MRLIPSNALRGEATPYGQPRPNLAGFENRSGVAGEAPADRPGLGARTKPTEDSDDCFPNGSALQGATGLGQRRVIRVQRADDGQTGRRPA